MAYGKNFDITFQSKATGDGLQQTKSGLESVTSQMSSLRERLEHVEGKLGATNEALSKNSSATQMLRESVEALQGHIDHLGTELEKAKTQTENNTHAFEQLTASLEKTESGAERAETRLQHLSATLGSTAQAAGGAGGALNALTSVLAQGSDSFTSFSGVARSASMVLAEINPIAGAVVGAISMVADAIEKAHEKAKQMELAKVRDELAALDHSVGDYLKHSAQIEDTNFSNHLQALDKLEKRWNNINEGIQNASRAQSQMDRANRKLAHAKIDHETNEALKNEKDPYKRRLIEQRGDAEKKKYDDDLAVKQADDHVKETKAKLEAHQDHVSALQRLKAKAKHDMEDPDNQLSKVGADLSKDLQKIGVESDQEKLLKRRSELQKEKDDIDKENSTAFETRQMLQRNGGLISSVPYFPKSMDEAKQKELEDLNAKADDLEKSRDSGDLHFDLSAHTGTAEQQKAVAAAQQQIATTQSHAKKLGEDYANTQKQLAELNTPQHTKALQDEVKVAKVESEAAHLNRGNQSDQAQFLEAEHTKAAQQGEQHEAIHSLGEKLRQAQQEQSNEKRAVNNALRDAAQNFKSSGMATQQATQELANAVRHANSGQISEALKEVSHLHSQYHGGIMEGIEGLLRTLEANAQSVQNLQTQISAIQSRTGT